VLVDSRMTQPRIRSALSSTLVLSTAPAVPLPDLSHVNAQLMTDTCYQILSKGRRKCGITNELYLLPGLIEHVITVKTTKAMLPTPQQQSWTIPRVISRWWGDSNHSSELDDAILRARKVIAILVCIEKLDAVPELLNDGITDQDLPLVRKEPREECHFTCHCGKKQFLSFETWSHQALDRFQQSQRLALAPDVEISFDTTEPVLDIPLHPGCGLPFSCEQVSGGIQNGYSDVYKASLQHAKLGPSQTRPFAIKKFFKKEFFEAEKKNLDDLRREKIKNPHLIQYLAACEQIPCIIFPWADGGDLKQCWEENDTKTAQGRLDPDLIPWSLHQILGLARALKDLHYINCRHGDIKPGNILHFPDEDGSLGMLKLADVGISKIHAHPTFQRKDPTKTSAYTQAYEAPEADENDPVAVNKPRSRAYDLWSLGCVITEFAQWLLNGNQGLKSFENERYPSGNRFYKKINPDDGQPSTLSVHPAVDSMIGSLNNHEVYRGSVLEEVVKLARENLLVIEPSERMKADILCKRLEEIVNRKN